MKLQLGKTLKRLRREKDITQEELAEILGVSFQSVSRWELGVTELLISYLLIFWFLHTKKSP